MRKRKPTKRKHLTRKKSISSANKLSFVNKIERVIFIILVIFLAFWAVTYAFNPRTSSESLRPSSQSALQPIKRKSIRIKLLNGCGVSGACSRMEDFLFKAGFDVVGKGNAKSTNYPHTLIIDRKGTKEKAFELAKFLELPHSSVITHKEARSSSIEDVILLLGKDYKRINR